MIIGVPKEIKTHEHRVGLVPDSVGELVQHGHAVVVQTSAGDDIGVSDQNYVNAGAKIVSTSDEVFAQAELIIKVKEPHPEECKKLNPSHVLFTFLHLAANKHLIPMLLQSGVTAIAYETVSDAMGGLPILRPMSMIAGKVVVQRGAHYLEKPQGGRGILLGSILGVTPTKVTILGAGVVGTNAADVALGMGAHVFVVDKSNAKLQDLSMKFERQYGGQLQTLIAEKDVSDTEVIDSDLVIGAILEPGAQTKKMVTREVVKCMRAGSVIADVAIDQGGCFETSRPTNFSDPIYLEHGIIHQCITNLPSAVPRTSAFALNHATLPYILEIAQKGYKQACLDNPGLLAGLNICQHAITYEPVAEAAGLDYVAAINLLQAH